MKHFFLSFLIIICLVISLGIVVLAQDEGIPEIPQIPMFVKGNVYANDKPIKSGAGIEARIDDEVKGNAIIGEGGEFGLPVPGKGEDSGKEIDFYVNGVLVNTTLPWESGEIKEDVVFHVAKEDTTNTTILYVLLVVLVLIIAYFLLRKKGKRKK